jgi:hypothetical protein
MAAVAAVDIFSPCESIGQRCLGLSGKLLQDRVFDLYVLSKDVAVPFFTEAGERNLHTHVENDRRQLAVVEQYLRSIIDKGNVVGVRGAPWLVGNLGSASGPYGMICHLDGSHI